MRLGIFKAVSLKIMALWDVMLQVRQGVTSVLNDHDVFIFVSV
jgi:hypothetical protein